MLVDVGVDNELVYIMAGTGTITLTFKELGEVNGIVAKECKAQEDTYPERTA